MTHILKLLFYCCINVTDNMSSFYHTHLLFSKRNAFQTELTHKINLKGKYIEAAKKPLGTHTSPKSARPQVLAQHLNPNSCSHTP